MSRIKTLLAAVAALMTALSCAPKKTAPKALVLYYSQTSNTKTVAETIASSLGADLEEVVLVHPYDGSYQETIKRSLKEREEGTLPEIQPVKANLADYDIIFLGYPIWFGTYAPPVASLLESIDLNGKKVVPFCTFGSGGLVSSSADLAKKFPDAEVLPGYGVRAARMAAVPGEVDTFLKAGGFLEGEVVKPKEFPAVHPASEEEAAIFDKAVDGYPMINAKAVEAASRAVPGGTEYHFIAENLPREGAPEAAPTRIKVYVLAAEGKAPEFTQVVR